WGESNRDFDCGDGFRISVRRQWVGARNTGRAVGDPLLTHRLVIPGRRAAAISGTHYAPRPDGSPWSQPAARSSPADDEPVGRATSRTAACGPGAVAAGFGAAAGRC